MANHEPISSLIEDIGSRLRQARMAAGYKTQAEFAEVAGVDKTTYNAHEKRRTGIPVPRAVRYSQMLNCDLAWLLTGKGSMTSSVANSNAIHLPDTLSKDVQEALRIITSEIGADYLSEDEASLTDPEVLVLRESVDLFMRVHGDTRPKDVELIQSAIKKVKSSGAP